jgi:DNA-binding response OmpR family regulator
MRLLIADDDAVSRGLLRASLNRAGHVVIEASDGREAWRILEGEEGPRLAILDWMMPELDGLEICRRLRRECTSGYTYVILLTSRGYRKDIIAGLEAGADDYLVKPCHPQELRFRVHAGERVLSLEQTLATRLQELEDALAHVKRLQGLLPICMYCKRIRDEADVWHRLESYLEEHSEALFSHSLCRECWKKHFPDFSEERRPPAEP